MNDRMIQGRRRLFRPLHDHVQHHGKEPFELKVTPLDGLTVRVVCSVCEHPNDEHRKQRDVPVA